MDSLLSRFAEDSYWLTRYVERSESLARLLDVTKSFGDTNDAGANWAPVIDLFADRQRYASTKQPINALGVIRFYVLDRTNPNSLCSTIGAAHHNARSLRHLISVEMWTHINMFANRMEALRPRDVTETRLAKLCSTVKNDCQLFQGSTRNTLYRDQVWLFFRIGYLIERCDQTTRLVDIMSRSAKRGKGAVAQAIEVSHWHSLLRTASAYHGYLRVHPHEINAQTVASYILFDNYFPGSIAFCLRELKAELKILEQYVSEKQIKSVRRHVRVLEKLAKPHASKILSDNSQQFLDSVQLALIGLHNAIAENFFPRVEPSQRKRRAQ